jgi:hypothetical protein
MTHLTIISAIQINIKVPLKTSHDNEVYSIQPADGKKHLSRTDEEETESFLENPESNQWRKLS